MHGSLKSKSFNDLHISLSILNAIVIKWACHDSMASLSTLVN